MKILHIHSEDGQAHGAGAHIMMNRLHHGLKKNGVESKIVCGRKTPGFEDAVPIKRTGPVKIAERLLGTITLNMGLNELHNFSCLGIKRLPEFKACDLIHVHGLHGGFFSYPALPALARQKPMVFTLHDMWSFTGHCTSSFECERWKSGCGQCPHPENFPSIRRDNTHLEWKLKKHVYSRMNLDIVSISEDQEMKVRQSMLAGFPIHLINNAIDTTVYRPMDSVRCRLDLNIQPNRKVIMFGATDMMRMEKGGDLLVEALRGLPATLKEKITLLSFGHRGHMVSEQTGLPSIDLGYVDGDELKAALYSAADLFVVPSRQESFGLVTLESMACGTPVVAFPVGSSKEVIHQGQTGYLADFEDAGGLGRAMATLLENDGLRADMGKTCRDLMREEYDEEPHVRRYQKLYSEILSRPACG